MNAYWIRSIVGSKSSLFALTIAWVVVLGISPPLEATVEKTFVGSASDFIPGTVQTEAKLDLMLGEGKRLRLAEDGTSLSVQSDAGSRVVAHHAISPARMGASLTRLPSGRILVWGGRDARGSVRSGGLLFDLERNVLVPFDIPGLSSRAGNAVTVLTDGRVLFVGDGARGAELWDEDSGKMRKLPVPDDMTRTRFASELQADGRVLLTPHNDTAPGRNDRFLFDPERDIFLRESDDRPGSMMASATTIAESIPAQKATGVDASAPLAIRFTHVADINTLTPAQITLVGPSGATSLKVVPAEQGRLIFIRPSQPLFPGARYTLFVNGVGTDDGQRLAMTAIDFQTASMGVPVPVVSGLTAPVISTGDLPAERCTGPNGHAFPCREHSTLREGVWTPGRDNMGARWRLPGSQPIPTHHGLRSMWLEALGWRVLTGRVLRVDGVPVARVEVNVGDVRGYTDDDGNFTLYGVPMGHQEIYVDGSTANRPGFEYGQFVIGVDVAEKGLTDLSHVMYLPRISARDKVKISSPLRQDVVVTHPDMPGLMIEIPANTVIRDRKGRLVDELAIVPTPVNRAPFPVADNYPMYFTLEPGGAIVQPLTPDGARGIRVFYPNYDDHPVGTEASFWIYDPVDGWRVYGQGHVTADGGMFAPDPGVALHETMGGSYSVNNASPANQEGAPDQQPCGPGCPAGGVSAIAGDPVELKTGAFYYNEADIVIQDIVPLQLERSYSTYDPASHEFGVGTRASYGYTLSLDSASGVLSLILPNGAPIKFERTSGSGANGAWEQRGSAISALSGAVIQVITDNGHKYRMTLRDGSLMQFSSYAPNYLLWTQDRYGNRINYEYDAGLVSRIVSPVGRYIAFEYDGNKRIKTAKDHTGRIWQYRYDVQGMLSEVIYPDRTSRQYRYDVKPKLRATWGRNTVTGKRMLTVMADNASRIHRLTSIVDQRGHTIFENTYDPDFDPVAGGDPAIVDYRQYWRVFSQKQADGSLLHFDYEVDADFLTTQTTVTYPDGSIRRVEFAPDSAYPLQDTSGTGAAQRIYRFERDSANRVTARIDPLGRRTEYERDAMGRITRTTVMPGTQDERTVRVEYNAEGDPVRIIDPLGRITRMEYWNGCPIRVTNSLGQITRYGCNVAGQVVSMTSPSGDTTTLEYWGYDLSRITNSRGKSIQFRYDVLGRLIAAEDPQGRIARQAYDLMDRVDHQIDPSGNMTEFGYDANGNLLAVLLPHGNGVTYQYDARNRLIHRADSLNQAESWSYDPMDRVSTYTDRMNRVTRYAYNAHGERIETVYPDAVVEQADYDQGGRLRALTSSESGRLEWQYDVLNQLTAAINPQGRIDYEYDLVGRRIGMTPASQARVEYRYDQGDRLTRLLQGNETVQFDYDIGNRLTRMVLPNGVKTDYRYDALGQLTDYLWNKADGSSLGGMALEYDEAGRIVAQSGTNGFSPETLPTSSQNNQFDDNNRQMQFNGQSLSYDANGNLVDDGQRTYHWNVRNQLVEIRQGGSTIARFAYDPLGRRVSKTEDGQTVTYLYDGHDTVQETHGNTVIPVLTGPGIDQRYARTDNGGRTYFLTDHLGSTRALTNADGDIVQRYDYDPYGVTIASSGGFSNPYQYTGRERDQSGLYYYRARYYSSGMGRFISEDPIGLLAGINMYGYVGGSPIRFSDPYGLQTIVLPWTPTMPIPFPGTLIDPVLMPMSPADIDQSLGEYTDSSTGTKEQCPRECAGLLSQLREHQRKLQQYKSDPFSMDNNGFLINASPERQRSIIDGRIRSLERQIENFERQYWNCMIKNGAIL